MSARYVGAAEVEVTTSPCAHLAVHATLRYRFERPADPAVAGVRVVLAGHDITTILEEDPRGRQALAELLGDTWPALVSEWLAAWEV